MKTTTKAIILTAALACGLHGQDKTKVIPGFNAVETSYRTDNAAKTSNVRLYGNATLHTPKVDIGLSATNDWDNQDPTGYFGRNLLLVGKRLGNSAVLETFTTANGTTWRGGIRDKHLANLSKKTYGYQDLTFGKKDMNLTAFEGIVLPGRFSVELFASVNKAYGGKAALYTEVQSFFRVKKSLAGGSLDAYFMWQHATSGNYNGYRFGTRFTR